MRHAGQARGRWSRKALVIAWGSSYRLIQTRKKNRSQGCDQDAIGVCGAQRYGPGPARPQLLGNNRQVMLLM